MSSSISTPLSLHITYYVGVCQKLTEDELGILPTWKWKSQCHQDQRPHTDLDTRGILGSIGCRRLQGVCQVEGHYEELEGPIHCYASSLWFIPLCYSNLVIVWPEVELRKIPSSIQLGVEYVFVNMSGNENVKRVLVMYLSLLGLRVYVRLISRLLINGLHWTCLLFLFLELGYWLLCVFFSNSIGG